MLDNFISRCKDSKIFNKFANDVRFYFTERMISVKYNKVVEYTLDVFNGNKQFDPNGNDVINKFLFVENDIILTLGAGTVTKIGPMLLEK